MENNGTGSRVRTNERGRDRLSQGRQGFGVDGGTALQVSPAPVLPGTPEVGCTQVRSNAEL